MCWSFIALYQIQIGYNRFLTGDIFPLDSKLRPQPQNLIDFYRKMFNIQAIISGRGLVEGRFHSEGDPFDRVVIRSLEQ
jgi:hypothetical protein